MLRAQARRYRRTAAEEVPVEQPCETPGCTEPGSFRAPKGRDGANGYFRFCLEHVRAYNKAYNYFADMTPAEIEHFQHSAPYGHRPTWPMGLLGAFQRPDGGIRDPFGFTAGTKYAQPEKAKPERRFTPEERRAFAVLEMEPTDDLQAVKSRYKQLVKRFHPDANGGDRAAEDRLKTINQAYSVLSAGLS